MFVFLSCGINFSSQVKMKKVSNISSDYSLDVLLIAGSGKGKGTLIFFVCEEKRVRERERKSEVEKKYNKIMEMVK